MAKSFKIKRYALLGIGLVSIVAVVGVSALSRGNLKIGEIFKDNPQAITVKGSEPDKESGKFHYEDSSELVEGSETEYKKVPVPTGYVGSTDPEERYVNGVTTEGVREHHGGFVIYEKNAGESDEQARVALADLETAKTTRNQYVWVPISNTEVDNEVNNMYHPTNGLIYGNYYTFSASSEPTLTKTETREPVLATSRDYDHSYLKQYLEGTSREEFLQEMREEFHAMLESVKTYGGFYIGRYETGNINQNKPVVVKNNTNISNVPWYKMYTRCRNLRGTNPVHTGLIWGIQWDETLKWLVDSGEKTNGEIVDSTSWGNYSNSTVDGHGSKNPTGYREQWKANNIYDLAGNVYDWTMESNGSGSRYTRGGYYNGNGSNNPAQDRGSGDMASRYDFFGCRAALYICNPES